MPAALPTSEEKWSPLWPLPPSIHRWSGGRTREPRRVGWAETASLVESAAGATRPRSRKAGADNGWHGKRPAQGQGDRSKVDRGARKDRRRLRQGAESSQCRLLGANGEGAQGGRGFSFGQTGPRLDLPREAAGEPLLILSLIHISEPTRLGMISYAVFC